MNDGREEEKTPPGLWALFFRGLHFSIFTLWGLVFGAGLSVPIVLDYWRYAFGMDLTWAGVIGLGCYLLGVGFLGTLPGRPRNGGPAAALAPWPHNAALRRRKPVQHAAEKWALQNLTLTHSAETYWDSPK